VTSRRQRAEGSGRASYLIWPWGLAFCMDRERLACRRPLHTVASSPDTRIFGCRFRNDGHPCAGAHLYRGWSACWPRPALIVHCFDAAKDRRP
jgi:hypothetical protein